MQMQILPRPSFHHDDEPEPPAGHRHQMQQNNDDANERKHNVIRPGADWDSQRDRQIGLGSMRAVTMQRQVAAAVTT